MRTSACVQCFFPSLIAFSYQRSCQPSAVSRQSAVVLPAGISPVAVLGKPSTSRKPLLNHAVALPAITLRRICLRNANHIVGGIWRDGPSHGWEALKGRPDEGEVLIRGAAVESTGGCAAAKGALSSTRRSFRDPWGRRSPGKLRARGPGADARGRQATRSAHWCRAADTPSTARRTAAAACQFRRACQLEQQRLCPKQLSPCGRDLVPTKRLFAGDRASRCRAAPAALGHWQYRPREPLEQPWRRRRDRRKVPVSAGTRLRARPQLPRRRLGSRGAEAPGGKGVDVYWWTW